MSSEPEHSPRLFRDRIVGVSAQMQRVYTLIHQASTYNYPVLITGEKGTGKRLAAQTIHSLSQRKQKSFVVADFSQLAPTLAEAELFGYERGAFAGAMQAHWGFLAFAREGSLLLNEIAELSPHLQARFLQVLQDRQFKPIGSIRWIPFKARILATTSRDLNGKVKRGTFREDLFVWLSGMQIHLPPLRERKQDIPLLIDYFLQKHSAPEGHAKFSAAAVQYLCERDWPENIRELEQSVQNALAACSSGVVQVDDLKVVSELPDDRQWAADLTTCLDERERQGIIQALRESRGDKSAAARRLGIAESALQKRLQYYHL